MTDLKKLKKIWAKKLKASGFDDIETEGGKLKRYEKLHWNSVSPLNFEEQQKYYILAGQLLHSHPFGSIRDKTIWRYHTQGHTLQEIADKVGLSKMQVGNIVNELSKYIKNE